MQRFVRAKLHGIRVTGADLNYHGSITLDPEICRQAGLDPLEFVEIWNKSSGARIATYVLYGEPGSRCCVLNGAAARTCQVGDEVIIASATYGSLDDVVEASPKVLTFDERNEVAEALAYRVFRNERGEPDMAIENGGAVVPIRRLVG
ncbi:aspartate 1-decarboxylase [Hansschlegelia zhihuaiae]|uniref:Aspartate 1-decarboxylase n=1 Tax=Hansschlegelia zhihuaiae TaxID=405005 RepID=A0A4Q0M910_9HYPH|nr:aspartate 1-decarboxylase [Hansschlegelia zhihuaiae]RXF69614.1 aspartate 1-decarboxylase [Hansschlegelia zhihuaiae]